MHNGCYVEGVISSNEFSERQCVTAYPAQDDCRASMPTQPMLARFRAFTEHGVCCVSVHQVLKCLKRRGYHVACHDG